jgi:hypothetical protein
MEAVFAGAMLSGVGWARMAHAVNAGIGVTSAFIAGLICVITLRGIANGFRLGLTLLSLAAVLFIQAAVGALSARGTNLLWTLAVIVRRLWALGVSGRAIVSIKHPACRSIAFKDAQRGAPCKQRAQEILCSMVQGLDPFNGEVLPLAQHYSMRT